jgi:hypothetical protein
MVKSNTSSSEKNVTKTEAKIMPGSFPDAFGLDKQFDNPAFYQGYDIKWLRNNPDHPHYYLVAEYDEKQKKG